jgi:protein TonB
MPTVAFSTVPTFSSPRPAALQARRPPTASALELAPPSRRWFAGVILAVHALGGWALLQSDWMRQTVLEAQPVLVTMRLLADAPKAVSRPSRQPAPLDLPAPTPPRLLIPAFSIAALAVAQEAPPAPALPPVVQAAAPALLALAAPPTLAAPAAKPVPVSPIKQIAPNAVRYLVEPRMSVPLLSRRLGESGIVHLRILVDARGNLKEASLRKTSGFARLDQQALQDIRSARFSPYVENGQAIEWETIALLSYEVEK